MAPLVMFTACWGDNTIHLMERALLRSLSWPKNKAAIKDSTWFIYTKKEDIEKLEVLTRKYMPHHLITILEMTEQAESAVVGDSMPWAIMQGFINCMDFCLKRGARMLTAPPDTMFGEGSIANMLQVGVGQGVCVFVPHMRVHPSILEVPDELSLAIDYPESNAELVSLAMDHAHTCWTGARIGHPQNNSFFGGIAWRQLDRQLWEVYHRLPTPYVINFLASDMTWWSQQIEYGSIDHTWSGECMIDQGRQRLIGSSDCAFMVEITEPLSNVPPANPMGTDSDKFWRNAKHNEINKLTACIWRGHENWNQQHLRGL